MQNERFSPFDNDDVEEPHPNIWTGWFNHYVTDLNYPMDQASMLADATLASQRAVR